MCFVCMICICSLVVVQKSLNRYNTYVHHASYVIAFLLLALQTCTCSAHALDTEPHFPDIVSLNNKPNHIG